MHKQTPDNCPSYTNNLNIIQKFYKDFSYHVNNGW